MFYVYEHWRPDTNTCFYVGRGHRRRAWDMRRGRNRHHKFIQEKLTTNGHAVEIKIVAENLTDAMASLIEIEAIAVHRICGTELCNISAGGDGNSGPMAAEHRQKISAALTGKKKSPEHAAKVALALAGKSKGRGRVVSRNIVDKIAASNRGKKRTPEQRLRMSVSQKLRDPATRAAMTPDIIDKIRSKQIGKPKSEETKARMRAAKSLRFAVEK